MSLLNTLHFAHYCIFNSSSHPEADARFSTIIYKIPKTKLTMTFKEFRQELFYWKENWVANKGKLIKMYNEDRLEHKQTNKKLHDLFYTFKKRNFTTILQENLNLHTLSPRLDVSITNARHIGYNDSDGKSLVAEDEDHFYYATSYRL